MDHNMALVSPSGELDFEAKEEQQEKEAVAEYNFFKLDVLLIFLVIVIGGAVAAGAIFVANSSDSELESTSLPTLAPTLNPTASPTQSPTLSPTNSPTESPTASPTFSPTVNATVVIES